MNLKLKKQHITSWLNAQNDFFSDSFGVIFQNSHNLKSRSNRWMIFFTYLTKIIYFSNSLLIVSPSRDL